MARGGLSLSFGLALVAALSVAQVGCDPGGGAGKPCTSSAQCPSNTSCTTEMGVCNPPPGCDPARGDVCPAVCYGTCEPSGGGACRADSDCRLFSDYCTGCDCRALLVGAPDPTCNGPGVQCLIDPCENKRAVCSRRACVVVSQ
jgi:hypothetical protein